MYQSFTGSSRRPRQVNLSGRNANPFAAASAPSAVESAHQDRQLRQRQRDQLNAARLLQRVWRGYSSRRRTKDSWRRVWDDIGRNAEDTAPYSSEAESYACLHALLLFFSPSQRSDVDRVVRYTTRQKETVAVHSISLDLAWRQIYTRLETSCLAALSVYSPLEQAASRDDPLLGALTFVVLQIPEESARLSLQYYKTLADRPPHVPSKAFQDALYAPLRSRLPSAYEGLAAFYLTRPHEIPALSHMADNLDMPAFIKAASDISTRLSLPLRGRLWLLAQYIFIIHQPTTSARSVSSFDLFAHIPTIARLLATLADDIAPEAPVLDMSNCTYDQEILSVKHGRVPLNEFLQAQIRRLVDQRGIRSLLARPEAGAGVAALDSASDTTQSLAGYALTLLRMFPSRADDIRMWLYLGPPAQNRTGQSIPATTYFWGGARKTNLFGHIFRNPSTAIRLLTPAIPSLSSWQPPNSIREQSERIASEWRVMIVFLELYTFVLKIMDDEEFLGEDRRVGGRMSNNALPLTDIKDLTVFLKNLGFAMYFHAQDISDALQPAAETLTSTSLARHFAGSIGTLDPEPEVKSHQPSVAGIAGMSLDYLKGLVTGLLRAIYERDSRRHFLPKNHWLMTSRFDMSNFIQAVVGEEERRSQLELHDEDDEDDDEDLAEEGLYTFSHTGRAQNRQRHMVRNQRRASRKRYLQNVAPRLEILQNMPFLIPFETRVEVFREFVRLDQAKRRGGYVDSDTWRSYIMFRNPDGHSELNRHHAVVRRKHEFADAFDSFYELGPDFKEPIQITFKDEFDIVEAGIDGGGVTKEFLTSVTSQAFNPSQRFFKENAQHVLYPNPASAEEVKDELRLAQGLVDTDPDVQESVNLLMRQYEFMGRIVGKCLYEGILIDIGFAGFFLSQWSLFKAGPTGHSAYRPTINDLCDLDEGLYKGLLDLKYYPGSVEEDIPLTFTVIDEVTLSNGKTRTIESELVPDGSNQTVTSENRLLYISLMARWRLVRQSYRQTNNFLKGLSSIVEPGWLSMFNQLELQTLIGGAASSIDVADLRRNTQYGGVYQIGDDLQEHESVKHFWEAMETMSDEDRRKVLKFVTSTPRAPLLGFGSLNPRFSIRDSGADESRFPTTSTCVNLLKLPRYKTVATLREKLLYAVNSGAGFDLS